MPAANPVDRDRGLRLVGVVTTAVTAVSLIGIGATTALAAGETRHRDEARAASAAPGSSPSPAPAADPTTAPTSRPRVEPSARADRSKRDEPATSSASKAPTTTRTARAEKAGTGTGTRAPVKPKRPKPVATTTAGRPATTPPPVPSTGS